MADGEPALAVQADNERYKMKRPFYYCVECRGPAPPGLPPAGPKQQRTKRMTGIGKIQLPVDWQKLAAGDRE